MRRRRRGAWLWVLVVVQIAVAWPSPAVAQDHVENAIRFYLNGGAYCFRVAPPGVALSEETVWTVMVLTSTSSKKTSFKIRELDPGVSNLSGGYLRTAGEAVTSVWRVDRERADFFQRFEDGIKAGRLRARVVEVLTKEMSKARSDRERAELYLKFSERGSRVAFDKAADLTAEEFARYAEHLPD